ncbi:MAG TPA: sigma-70 family RNA polymerase sigma factor [Cyclobacteriaceae bacterium]|nr:sigma-70 family RNA polymerase sigma factor [Cyclobacteriaceae bacterium]
MSSNVVKLAADTQLTDSSIISGILAGKKEDYEILIRRYNNMLYKTARGILTEEEDIEDVMQEAYIRGFEKLHQFRNEAKFSTWLTRILINCALQFAGKLKGRRHLDVDALSDDDVSLSYEAPDPRDNVVDIAGNLGNAIEAAVSQIPPKYRVVFVLREIEQVSVGETAEILGISQENVKVRLHRAKAMLRDILKSSLNALEIFEYHATRCALMAERVMGILTIQTR